ncbi:Multidrug resistance-associated protein 1 [Globomyces sp. JEL0801]|nr:Multidrug resistance-associated protein 1 [Globomyces sp. JEL0801]
MINEKQEINPNFWDYVTMGWMNLLLLKNNKEPISDHEFELNHKLKTNHNVENAKGYRQRYNELAIGRDSTAFLNFKKYGLLKTILAFNKVQLVIQFVLSVLLMGNRFLSPFLVQQVIYYVQSKETVIDSGIGLAFMLFGTQVLESLLNSLCKTTQRHMSIASQEFLVDSLYKKSLNMAYKERSLHPPGKILNIVNTDVEFISEALASDVTSIFLVPTNLILIIFFIYQQIGWAVFPGFAYIVAVLFGTSLTTPLVTKFNIGWMNAGDDRLAAIREMIHSITVIKFKAMEDYIKNKIFDTRRIQVANLRNLLICLTFVDSFIQSSAIAVGILCFVVYAAQGHPMTPDVVFPTLIFIKLLPGPLDELQTLFLSFLTTKKSLDRVSEVLVAEEIVPLTQSLDMKNAVALDSITWSWSEVQDVDDYDSEDEEEFQIDPSTQFSVVDVSLDIKLGELVGVIGPTGSGKTTFLNGLIGFLECKEGSMKVNGTMAYCPQEPWIMSGTIKSNILFGLPLVKEKLNEIVKVCGLERDLTILSDGIETDIAESGANLSGKDKIFNILGGQKARISLARALYSDADIYVLDCPLAALDSKVGKYVFNNAIMNYLKSKTVIIVTHHLNYLSLMDKVIMLEEGKVVQYGAFFELPSSVIDSMASVEQSVNDAPEDKEEEEEDPQVNEITAVVSDATVPKPAPSQITKKEEKSSGAVKLVFYKRLAKSIGFVSVVLYIIFTLLKFGALIATPVWLSVWSAADGKDTDYYLTGYSIIGSLNVLFVFGFMGTCAYIGVVSSSYFHDHAVIGLLNTPVNFFSENPTGRIINRLSSDVHSLDFAILNTIDSLTNSYLDILNLVILICLANPYLVCKYMFNILIVLVLMIAIFVSSFYIFKIYKKLNIELKRLRSIHKSPMDDHFSQTLDGLSSIHAYQKRNMFIEKEQHLIDNAQCSRYLLFSLSLWLKIRLSVLSSFTSLIVGLIAVESRSVDNIGYAAVIGLSLAYTSEIAGAVNVALISMGQGEAEMNSIERLSHYAFDLPQEAKRVLKSDPDVKDWPVTGNIAVKNLVFAYPSNPDEPCLKDISFNIKTGEKIGVVGRTGSGKSTLATTFFRLMEFQKGTIFIDGKDVNSLGLHTLRSRIEIVTQEPVLFSGTIRSNLDYQGILSDELLWKALEDCGLKDFVTCLDGKLDASITTKGENISSGQRQLICLARSLLKNPILLIMDEATAQIDSESDRLVQRVVQSIQNITVLSIAHRLETIADYDKVVVLNDGELAEFDSIHTLLSDPESILSQLCDSYNPTVSASIRKVAQDHFEENSKLE